MDNTEQLLIRACKSGDPITRLLSVYRRFYLPNETPKLYLAHILAGIVDKYVPVTATEMIFEFDPKQKKEFFGEDFTYTEIALGFVLHKIRYADRAKFPGLTTPCAFRQD